MQLLLVGLFKILPYFSFDNIWVNFTSAVELEVGSDCDGIVHVASPMSGIPNKMVGNAPEA